jgi:hypothetical protein
VRLLLEGRLVCQPFEEGAARGYAFIPTGTYRRLGFRALDSTNAGGDPGGFRCTEEEILAFELAGVAEA